jgi:hypothetical protein
MQTLQQSLLLQAADDDRRQTFQPRKILALTTIEIERVRWPAQPAQMHPHSRHAEELKQVAFSTHAKPVRAMHALDFAQVLEEVKIARRVLGSPTFRGLSLRIRKLGAASVDNPQTGRGPATHLFRTRAKAGKARRDRAFHGRQLTRLRRRQRGPAATRGNRLVKPQPPEGSRPAQ